MSPYMMTTTVSDANENKTIPPASIFYRLHGVLVHSGDVGGGHYYAFIRSAPSETCKWGSWLRFDDEIVHPVSQKEAVDENFGGGGGSFIKRYTSAYMLVYVLESQWSSMVGGLPIVPEHILSSNNDSDAEDDNPMVSNEESKACASTKNETFVNVRLITDAALKKHISDDVSGLDFANVTESCTFISKVRI